jgi:hypothetical protein
MLIIRQAQFAVLSQNETRKFENWMSAHLYRFFPAECAAAGDDRVMETIRYGILRAAAHGVADKRDVCRYIDLMAVFGRDFDRDPKLRWASDILARRADSRSRMRALLVAAKAALRKRARKAPPTRKA